MSRGTMLIISACVALAIAGCGGGEDSSSSTRSASEATTTQSEGTAQSEKATTQKSEAAAPKSGAAAAAAGKAPKVTVPDGPPPKKLEEKELIEGTGAEAKAGDKVTVQYVGVGYESKEQFDASWDRGEPFGFTLGAGEVIPGWDEGVVGMKVGGRRELIVPPKLAYGPTGFPPAIGPNETLIFVIDLLAVK